MERGIKARGNKWRRGEDFRARFLEGSLGRKISFFLVSGGISSFATGLCFENTYIVIVCIYNFGIRKNLRKGMEEREIESN